MTSHNDHGQEQGPVVNIKIMSQVEDGPIHELGSYELTAPDQAPSCTAQILREVADEFETLGDEAGKEGR